MNEKKLYRSNERKVFGVCGGIAEYAGIDPTIVRIIWAFLALGSCGSCAAIYLIAAILMDNKPDYIPKNR